MKVLFVNRYFFPDASATSQMLSDLAFFLAARGFDVQVVTSRLDYFDPARRYPPGERIDGVAVHRVWSSGIGRGSLAGRAIDYLTFYIGAGIALVRLLARGDVLVAKTDPPLLSVVAALACRVRRAGLVNWLQDLFPEVARAAGVRLARGPLWHAARMARDWSLRAARVNVAIGERMRDHLAQLRPPAPRLTAIHNWADGEAIRPMDPASSPLRGDWGLAGRFVVAYAGNLGRVHDHATTLEVAASLRAEDSLVLLFVGQGVGYRRLRAEAQRRRLPNVQFRPPQPRERLGALLALGDAHLVTLAPGMGAFVVPSKLYGVLAAGRPVVFVGGADSEIPALLDEHQCGLWVPAGDAGALARALRQLAAEPALRNRFGLNARRLFDQRFAKPVALSAWQRVIEAASGRSPSV